MMINYGFNARHRWCFVNKIEYYWVENMAIQENMIIIRSFLGV